MSDLQRQPLTTHLLLKPNGVFQAGFSHTVSLRVLMRQAKKKKLSRRLKAGERALVLSSKQEKVP